MTLLLMVNLGMFGAPAPTFKPEWAVNANVHLSPDVIRGVGKVYAELVDPTTGAAYTGAISVYVTDALGAQTLGTVNGGAAIRIGNGLYLYEPSAAELAVATSYTFVGGSGAIPVSKRVTP